LGKNRMERKKTEDPCGGKRKQRWGRRKKNSGEKRDKVMICRRAKGRGAHIRKR